MIAQPPSMGALPVRAFPPKRKAYRRRPRRCRLWIRTCHASLGRWRYRSAYATRRGQRRCRDTGRWGHLDVVVHHRHPLVSKVFEFEPFFRAVRRRI